VQFKDYYQVLGVGARRHGRRRSRRPTASWRANTTPTSARSPTRRAHERGQRGLRGALRPRAPRRLRCRRPGPARRARPSRRRPTGTPASNSAAAASAMGMDAGEFSDFFAELFGRAGAGPSAGAPRGFAAARICTARRGPPRQDPARPGRRLARRHAPDRAALPQLDAQGRVRWASARWRCASRRRQARAADPPGRPGRAGPWAARRPATCSWRCISTRTRASASTAPHARGRAAGGAVGSGAGRRGAGAAARRQTLKVRVPAGAQGGRILRVRGKGLPGRTGRPGTGGARAAAQRLRPAGAQALRADGRRTDRFRRPQGGGGRGRAPTAVKDRR
jgi:curved DNA-binding protein